MDYSLCSCICDQSYAMTLDYLGPIRCPLVCTADLGIATGSPLRVDTQSSCADSGTSCRRETTMRPLAETDNK